MASSSRTLVCSVVFVDIAAYSRKPVAEQLQLKQVFNGMLAAALTQVAPRDRVVLDTGDGAAITFLGDPEDALFVATSIRDAALTQSNSALVTRIGINLGPVRLIRDINDQVNIIGDGINVAQRIMTFAQPGQLLVGRSFYEVVSRLSRDYAGLFRYEGARTDKHVREHEVYSVGAGATAARRSDAARARGGRLGEWLGATGPLGLRRSALLAAPLAFAALAGPATALRSTQSDLDARATLPVRPAVATSAPTPAPAPAPAAHAASPEPRAGAQRQASAAAQAARVRLAIAPWGEVLVDGKSRGVSPPLASLELPPGAHTIEIRNRGFPSRVERVSLNPGEQLRIRHRFK